ncbi:MAG: hypothetical protein WHT29_06680 [Bacteroidales bacterium]|nr:hypothetical protein [Bacteroidales bacterium]HOK99848.1 hypothetical protein [Bacteroidales bacterium]HPO66657.1 hypothetical protein [Bacteroidales bacterium]
MLTSHEQGWYSFADGIRWRIRAPQYLCEVGEANHIPSYKHLPSAVSKVQRIKAFYQRHKIALGQLDALGTGIDILVANAMTESLGTVPSPLEYTQLSEYYRLLEGEDGQRLDALVRYIASTPGARYLERREPGYINPLATPARVSLGSHHMLLSTALDVMGKKSVPETAKRAIIRELCLSLPSQSLKAAELAAAYLNRLYHKHLNHPPLVAATYNAGSPRYTSANPWHLVQYGQHIDRWIAYYNTSRMIP